VQILNPGTTTEIQESVGLWQFPFNQIHLPLSIFMKDRQSVNLILEKSTKDCRTETQTIKSTKNRKNQVKERNPHQRTVRRGL